MGITLRIALGRINNVKSVVRKIKQNYTYLHASSSFLAIDTIYDYYPPGHCQENRIIGVKRKGRKTKSYFYHTHIRIDGQSKKKEQRATNVHWLNTFERQFVLPISENI